VPEVPAVDDHQGELQPDQRSGPEVSGQAEATRLAPEARVEAGRSEVAAEHFRSGIGGQAGGGELEGGIGFDGTLQIGSSMTHRKWSCVEVPGWRKRPPKAATEDPSAPSFHIPLRDLGHIEASSP